MLAKRFFYVSAGILCLALAYHLGATSATAQGTSSGIVADIGCAPGSPEPGMSLVLNRVVYSATLSGTYGFQVRAPLPPIPGTSPVVAIDASCTGLGMLANGDVWAGGGPSWSYVGNVTGGPTPAVQQSWGQVKVEHR